MASSYSANQYDNAFTSQKLQNWTLPRQHKQHPSALEGRTQFITNDRGHLLPGMRSKNSSWSSFLGTWDLPRRIPPPWVNYTARSAEGAQKLQKLVQEGSSAYLLSRDKSRGGTPATPVQPADELPQAPAVSPSPQKITPTPRPTTQEQGGSARAHTAPEALASEKHASEDK
ncbi:protein Flattop [Polyodon spathula]|uniref:protein Flattop n=1 Tax=Polyodon spathula TaxID=7913 RepID=UPI001B7F4669|nr:protein Flattop [Polyodon spathula]